MATMTPEERRQQMVIKLARKAEVVKRVLATPEGQELMEILRKEFFTKIQGKDEHETTINAGRADVYSYLLALSKFDPADKE